MIKTEGDLILVTIVTFCAPSKDANRPVIRLTTRSNSYITLAAIKANIVNPTQMTSMDVITAIFVLSLIKRKKLQLSS
jgi:hypothetical protein